jgi:hypothetical protein
MHTLNRYSCMGSAKDSDGIFYLKTEVDPLLKELEGYRAQEKARKDMLQKEVKAFDEHIIREREKRLRRVR